MINKLVAVLIGIDLYYLHEAQLKGPYIYTATEEEDKGLSLYICIQCSCMHIFFFLLLFNYITAKQNSHATP